MENKTHLFTVKKQIHKKEVKRVIIGYHITMNK